VTTQASLVTSDESAALVSGEYFYHQRRRGPAPAVRDTKIQEQLLAECASISSVAFPD
jgi:hypothetical protein